MHLLLRPLAIVWASPYTLLGLFAGALGLCSGGGVRWRAGVVEFHGRAIDWFLRRLPVEPIAITFGHVVLGRTDAALDITRNHERVHVGQYERWGVLFGPAYLFCSLLLWRRGRDPYYDNPFEREAFARGGDREN
jgi:hypothetical protein